MSKNQELKSRDFGIPSTGLKYEFLKDCKKLYE